MQWLVTIIAVLPVLVMAFIALAPVQSHARSGAQWLVALICASLGSLILASRASSLLGLLPCEWQSYGPPCTNLSTSASPASWVALLGLGFWILALVVLLRNSATQQSSTSA